MARYDVDAKWDDPFEHVEERRHFARADATIRVTLVADDAKTRQRMVGPGVTENISESGMCLVTKHQLGLSQQVSLSIPTDRCPADLLMPATFEGQAEVVRVEPLSGKQNRVALRLGPQFTTNMAFAVFAEALQRLIETPVP